MPTHHLDDDRFSRTLPAIVPGGRLGLGHRDGFDTIMHSPEDLPGRYIPPLFPTWGGRWLPTTEGDTDARALLRRHSSCRARGVASKPRLFAGQEDRLILITQQADALIVFRKSRNPDRQFGQGVHCAVFRNEGHFRSCSLIREAVEEWAWKRWPGERIYTYITGRRIAATSPGYAFKCAGWSRSGVTPRALIVMHITPASA